MLTRCFLILFFSFISISLFAESFSMQGQADVVVKEGDDYFTDILNEPMDLDHRRDIQWEQQFDEASIVVENGVWRGKTIGSAAVYALYQGAHGPDATEPWSAAIGKRGINYPLDATKYTSFSVISSISSQDDRSQKAIAWTNGYASPSFVNTSKKYSWEDFYKTNTNPQIKYGSSDFILDVVDLSSNAAWDWSGNITGVLFDQSPAAAAGVVEQYKMFRIFDPLSSPSHTISWSYSDLPSYAGGQYYPPQVSIFISNKNNGSDGAFMKRVSVYNDSGLSNLTSGTGSYTFPTASLPPGEYYFYLKLMDNVGSDSLITKSIGSHKLTINAKARINFQNPSYVSGKDYATTELNNPWDFTNASDIANLNYIDDSPKKQIKNYSFVADYFQGTAFIPEGSRQTETEAQLWLNTSFPIDTSKYKYLTFKMYIEPEGYTNIEDKIGRGWVARVLWYNHGFVEDGSVTNDILLYEGVNTYSVDLSKVPLEQEEVRIPNTGWEEVPQATFFRFDPLEIPQDTRFKLYDVKLTANPEPNYNLNIFELKFSILNKENQPVTVDFYRDNDNSGFDGLLIHTGLYTVGSAIYQWPTSFMPEGDYYIYAKVIDEKGNVFKRYADVPITISKPVLSIKKVPYYRLYNPNTGEHHYTENHAEYRLLGNIGWGQESIAYYIYNESTTINSVATSPWYRLYNPNNGIHHWTLSLAEYNQLGSIGWNKEGVAGYFFKEPVVGAVALYRIYNPNNGMHHWTLNEGEKSHLIRLGWNDEGIAGYVFDSLRE